MSDEFKTISIDRKIIKAFEPDVAIFLINLFFRDSKDKGKFFIFTHEDQKQTTKLTDHSIRKSKKFLKKLGILDTMMIGIPAKEWYCINFNKLNQYLKLKG